MKTIERQLIEYWLEAYYTGKSGLWVSERLGLGPNDIGASTRIHHLRRRGVNLPRLRGTRKTRNNPKPEVIELNKMIKRLSKKYEAPNGEA